jgi:hypothetical protein
LWLSKLNSKYVVVIKNENIIVDYYVKII